MEDITGDTRLSHAFRVKQFLRVESFSSVITPNRTVSVDVGDTLQLGSNRTTTHTSSCSDAMNEQNLL